VHDVSCSATHKLESGATRDMNVGSDPPALPPTSPGPRRQTVLGAPRGKCRFPRRRTIPGRRAAGDGATWHLSCRINIHFFFEAVEWSSISHRNQFLINKILSSDLPLVRRNIMLMMLRTINGNAESGLH
jgi:hypothetical protein